MGNSGWTNDQPDNITLPPGAGPGEARIVIGPDLPPPLDTYLTAFGPYSSAIIFYGAGADDTYNYYAIVDDALPDSVITEQGSVVNGAVVENAPGDPRSIRQYADALGQRYRLTADSIEIRASGAIPLQGISITADNGDLALTTPAGSIRIDNDIDWASATAVEGTNYTASPSTASAAYVLPVLANRCGVAFIAPPSGMVAVHSSSALDHNTAASVAWMSPEVRQGTVVGSGAVVAGFAASDNLGISGGGTEESQKGTSMLVTGLTPGSNYNVSLWQRTAGAGTAFMARQRVTVLPAL